MSSARTFPLTTVERRFWLLHLLHPQAPIANIGRVVELRGRVRPDAMAQAFAVVAQNPVLRIRVREENGDVVGVLGAPPALVVDPDLASDDDVQAAVDEVVRAPYDLAEGPLCRARLLRRGDDDWVLVLGAHHLILDGWGLSRSLPRALSRALQGLQTTFGDEAALDDDTWIDARIRRAPDDPPEDARARDRAWWQERLRDASALPLPIVRPPPPRASGLAFDVEVPLSDDLFARVGALARTVDARAVHVFLAAFVVELARSGRTADLLLGTTRASRPGDDPDNHEMGCFVRTRPLRVQLGADAPFLDVVKACQRAVRESLDHPAFDAEELHQIDAPAIGALFNYIPFAAFDGDIPGVDVRAGRILAGGTAFPISLTVDEKGALGRMVLEVDADLFDEGFARRFVERVRVVLDDALARPHAPYTRLHRLGAVDLDARAKNAPTEHERAGVRGGHLVPLLRDDLRRDGPALVFVRDPLDPVQDVVVSRAELLRRTHAIAASLARAGQGRGAFVGVQCRDPIHAVTGILGALFSGAAYVPIDPAAPPLRRDAIVAQARCSVVLDDEAVRAAGLEDDEEIPDHGPPGTDAAYAIFTSGSTGTPKGVVVSHDAVTAQLQARAALGFPRVERSLLLAPFFFDGSVETLFWTLTTGGILHLLSEEARRDPLLIRQTLHHRRITYTSAVPALWSAVLDAAPAGAAGLALDSLGFVIVGGEKLTPQIIDKHNEHTHAWLVNEYGPTESTVFSTAWSAPRRGHAAPERVPIGRAAPHVRCDVVDDNLEPVPVLEAGELVVAGIGLAEGYLNAPALTAAAFVERPTPTGTERVYRTGDLVRLWPDGNLEWLARRDEQVKLRGLRVEPGEVEAALLAEGAREAAVVVEGHHLLAWVAPASLDEATLLQKLQARLPEAMIPARITVLPALPKTQNDKIDKRALPRVAVEDIIVPPETETERTIAAVWGEVLGLSQVSVTRSFFASGGHSLKAAIVVRRLSDALGVDVPLSALMIARTVRELARVVDEKRGGTTMSSTLLLPLTPRGVRRPSVVFLPGIGGHVFTFAGIAERMASPTAGLRAFGSEPGEEPLRTVPELAKKNLDELDRAGVADDIVFAGYSFGGLVAFEMALQREAAGRRPRHVVIFDTMAPGYPKKLPPWTRARLHAETLARRDWTGRVAYLKDRVDSVREKLNFKLARADAFKDAFALNADELAALAPAQRKQLERLAGVSTLAHHRYWPRASTSVPLTVFAAQQGFAWAATIMDDPLLGWGAWATGGVRRVELKGDHLRIFQAENLATAAAVLDRIVDDAGG